MPDVVSEGRILKKTHKTDTFNLIFYTAQVPRGGGGYGEFLPETMTDSRRGYMDPPAPSLSSRTPYMPSQNVRDGTYPYAGYVHQSSRPSSGPWEHVQVQPTYYYPGPIPMYNGQHDNIPSPRSARHFMRSRSRSPSTRSPRSHEHIPDQPPFVVTHEHPVPIWDRYVSVHPFQSHRPSDVHLASATSSSSRTTTPVVLPSGHLPPPASHPSTSTLTFKHVLRTIHVFLFDFLPRQLYISLLFGLPSLYFTRVARVFEDAELSKPDIRKMVHTTANEWEGRMVPSMMNWNFTTHLSPALLTFKRSWEEFVDSLMREWKTLNVVSVLLLSAILTVLQIQGAGDDPVTRAAALMSLICALMSLTYGCMYIVRFGTMKKMHKASSWADEAQKTDTLIWWNVWVLLAMPAVWLAWSMALFLLCILSFVWRTGSMLDPPDRSPLTPHAALGVRVGISGVLALGLLYALMIVKTLRRYGARMDEAWTNRALAWRMEDVLPPKEYCPRSRSDESIYRSNKHETIYGSRTRMPLYRPDRQDNVSPKIIPTALPRARTPDGMDTGNGAPVPTEELSVLFSGSIGPNNLPPPVRPSTPRASQPISSSQGNHTTWPSAPVPLDLVSQHHPVVGYQQQTQSDDVLSIPSFLFRPVKGPRTRPTFLPLKVQDDIANIQENEPSIPSVLLHYDVHSNEWSRFMLDLSIASAGRFPAKQSASVNQSDLVADFIDVWNSLFFRARGLSVSIMEDRSGSPPIAGEMKKHALYLNCAPERPSPVRQFDHFESDRLSSITERTEQASLDSETLGKLRSLPGGYDGESVVSMGRSGLDGTPATS